VKASYHRAITEQALQPYFGSTALETIVAANLGQDAIRYQFGHDHFHYDNNSFTAGNAYLDQLRQLVMDALQRDEAFSARESFGKLTHAAQDFYAHSNYVALWRQLNPQADPDQIHPLLVNLLQDPGLRSGRLYYPLEIFSFFPLSKPYVLPFLPRDSHAWMNKDDPSKADFAYAFAAAVKRTQAEYAALAESLSSSQIALWTGHASSI